MKEKPAAKQEDKADATESSESASVANGVKSESAQGVQAAQAVSTETAQAAQASPAAAQAAPEAAPLAVAAAPQAAPAAASPKSADAEPAEAPDPMQLLTQLQQRLKLLKLIPWQPRLGSATEGATNATSAGPRRVAARVLFEATERHQLAIMSPWVYHALVGVSLLLFPLIRARYSC